ncbi:roadblock/LC7 domain-containing protein [Actinomadura sp. NPDC048955]|uniref:roadblock/LC7 domain-containing protein n=1 Tax=Actinomadura sp. NPDC048955 TaxID=3158228 RepID=UPI0033C3EBF3
MTHPTTPFPAASVLVDERLDWLLDRFVRTTTGVTGALLVSRDGIKIAVSGLGTDQADQAAAWMGSLHSLARAAASISGSPSGGFRQVIVEDAAVLVFVTGADHAMGAGTGPPAESRLVGSVLGVLATPDADPDTIGFQMGLLVKSVCDHLTTPTRGGQ